MSVQTHTCAKWVVSAKSDALSSSCSTSNSSTLSSDKLENGNMKRGVTTVQHTFHISPSSRSPWTP